MKHTATTLLLLLPLLLPSCAHTPGTPQNQCQINGTLASNKWDGQYIFLVPINKNDNINVDSTKIHNRKFQFTTHKTTIADIRLSWRTRFGTQNLLVITEPGTINVTIDSISSSHGTPQNDSLQTWKQRTQNYHITAQALSQAYRNFYAAGDTLAGDAIRAQAQANHLNYRTQSLQMAQSMPGTTLANFLLTQFHTNN